MSTTDDKRRMQARLGVRPDGVTGPVTWAAFFDRVAGRPLLERGKALGRGAAAHFEDYGITTPLRLAHWAAQASHETMQFRYLREIWGPTAAQRRYEGRVDLGNTHAGDGKLFMGRGIFQLTGRANYKTYGDLLGLDLVGQPVLAEDPETSVLIACEYWKQHGLNALADQNIIEGITRKINGGTNGLAERKAAFARVWELVR